MILGMIGLWNKQERLKWFARKTDCEGDMPGPVRVKTFREDGTTMMCATELHDNRTMLPVSLLCLFDEQRRMHTARQLVAKVPKIIPHGCMVDGLFFTGPAEAQLELESLAEEYQYDHIDACVYQFKDAVWKEVPNCKQVGGYGSDCAKPNMRRVHLDWDIFREGRDDQALKDCLLTHYSEDELREIYQMVVDKNTRLDEFQVLTVIAASFNGGALVIGAAGSGKSEVLRSTKALHEEVGVKVSVCAYTHAACRLVKGQTIAHLLHLNKQIAKHLFLVDEVGLLPLSTLGAMSKWKAIGGRFMCFGDFDGQFEPFKDRWQMDASLHQHSALMHELCGGLRIELTKYRRGTDLDLFKWYHGMYDKEDVASLVEESRRRYPSECNPMDDPLVMCISHAKRMRVNTRQNERLRPAGAVYLEWAGEDLVGCTMQPQSMYIWPGLELIGCSRGSGKKDVVQGVLYVIKEITDTHVKLEMRDEYCKDPQNKTEDELPEVILEDVCSQLRLCHAMCYYTVQGRTIKDKPIVLLDTSHPHFSVRALIVALSRTTHGKWLHIGDACSDGVFAGERVVRQRA